jgi:hypothetical protein
MREMAPRRPVPDSHEGREGNRSGNEELMAEVQTN